MKLLTICRFNLFAHGEIVENYSHNVNSQYCPCRDKLESINDSKG